MTSLVRQIDASIRERGQATVDDLTSEYPQMTRQQLMKAMRNASYRGYIRLVYRKHLGRAKGSEAGIYAPVVKPVAKAAVSSVFDWAAQCGQECEPTALSV